MAEVYNGPGPWPRVKNPLMKKKNRGMGWILTPTMGMGEIEILPESTGWILIVLILAYHNLKGDRFEMERKISRALWVERGESIKEIGGSRVPKQSDIAGERGGLIGVVFYNAYEKIRKMKEERETKKELEEARKTIERLKEGKDQGIEGREEEEKLGGNIEGSSEQNMGLRGEKMNKMNTGGEGTSGEGSGGWLNLLKWKGPKEEEKIERIRDLYDEVWNKMGEWSPLEQYAIGNLIIWLVMIRNIGGCIIYVINTYYVEIYISKYPRIYRWISLYRKVSKYSLYYNVGMIVVCLTLILVFSLLFIPLP